MRAKFFHRYINPAVNFNYGSRSHFVVYYTDFGRVTSSSVWMVPGTWED